MSFPNNITAVQFSRFVVSGVNETVSGVTEKLEWAKFFGGASRRIDMGNIRDMPSFGTPANIIKVPVYGRDQTLSVGAQPDAPDLEFTINYVGSEWDADATADSINSIKADGVTRPMMVSLLSSQSDSSRMGMEGGGGLSQVPNGVIFFGGRVESALFNPMRDDAATVTVALSVQTDFFGPFTFDTYTIDTGLSDGYFLATNTLTRTAPASDTVRGTESWVSASSATVSSTSWDDDTPFLWSTTGSSNSYTDPILRGVF